MHPSIVLGTAAHPARDLHVGLINIIRAGHNADLKVFLVQTRRNGSRFFRTMLGLHANFLPDGDDVHCEVDIGQLDVPIFQHKFQGLLLSIARFGQQSFRLSATYRNVFAIAWELRQFFRPERRWRGPETSTPLPPPGP